MMTLLFILLTLAIFFAWMGYRQTTIYCYTLTIILASLLFISEMTTTLNLQL